MIIDEPKHYQKHATTRNPYIVLFGFVTVAELIGFGLKSTSLGTPGDFNTPIGVGSYYYWGSNATNAPDGFGIAYGTRIVLFSSSDNGNFELFFSRNNKKLYFRSGALWTSEWKELSLS